MIDVQGDEKALTHDFQHHRIAERRGLELESKLNAAKLDVEIILAVGKVFDVWGRLRNV